MLGLTAADVYAFDTEKLQPLADRIGPTPEDLGQNKDVDLSKWDAIEAAGRHWLTGADVVPVAVSD
jgi:hypothetical protein